MASDDARIGPFDVCKQAREVTREHAHEADAARDGVVVEMKRAGVVDGVERQARDGVAVVARREMRGSEL